MLKYFKFFTCCCIIVNLLMFCGACKKEDPYANKMCVKCGSQAAHCVSGMKPVNANENNCEQITGSIYRIFYCDYCWESVPKVELKP